MNKLPENFEMDKYGLHVRFVNENDAEFILKLRTDPKLSRYLHSTENNLEKQKEWIREYKNREKEGTDYYFLYEYNGQPIGVSRIYNIDYSNQRATGGSWVCDSSALFEANIATLLLARFILFEKMNLPIENFEVRKQNKQVIKTHKLFGAKVIGENEIEFLFELDKETFFLNKNRILHFLQLSED